MGKFSIFYIFKISKVWCLFLNIEFLFHLKQKKETLCIVSKRKVLNCKKKIQPFSAPKKKVRGKIKKKMQNIKMTKINGKNRPKN